jgi:hypothetical protein
MKRILLALGIGMGVFTVATATTSSYGGPKKYDNLAKDTVPKKDTTKRRDTMSANILVMPQQ